MKKVSLSLLSCVFIITVTGCGGGPNPIIIETKDEGGIINPNNNSDARTLNMDLYEQLVAATVKIKVGDDGWGSGFFIGDEGYIVTNNHVVVGAGELRVDIKGEDRLINAKSIAYAECADLAVIKLTSSTKLPPSPLNKNSLTWHDYRVAPAMTIASAGFPSTVQTSAGEPVFTYTEGSVQTEPRQVDTKWASTEAFNHGALVANGNSGGPLVEVATGEVVGVNYSRNDKTHRQLAISGVMAKSYVERMVKGENIHSIGISPKVSLYNDRAMGVLVEAVVPGKHADKIGIKAGDHIYALGGEYLWQQNDMDSKYIDRISTLDKYCSILRSQEPNNPKSINDEGTVIAITIYRHTEDGDVLCSGQINGDPLTLKNDSSTICPDAQKFEYKSNRNFSLQTMEDIGI